MQRTQVKCGIIGDERAEATIVESYKLLRQTERSDRNVTENNTIFLQRSRIILADIKIIGLFLYI